MPGTNGIGVNGTCIGNGNDVVGAVDDIGLMIIVASVVTGAPIGNDVIGSPSRQSLVSRDSQRGTNRGFMMKFPPLVDVDIRQTIACMSLKDRRNSRTLLLYGKL